MQWERTSEGSLYGYQGKWQIFVVRLRPKNSELGSIKLKCNLPGIKHDLGNYKSENAAKEKAQAIMRHWLDNLGIRIKRRIRKKRTINPYNRVW